MWTTNDKRFLRSLRIASANPPTPLGRFRVCPSEVDGRYIVYDTHRKNRSVYDVGPDEFQDPYLAAGDLAAKENSKYVEKK